MCVIISRFCGIYVMCIDYGLSLNLKFAIFLKEFLPGVGRSIPAMIKLLLCSWYPDNGLICYYSSPKMKCCYLLAASYVCYRQYTYGCNMWELYYFLGYVTAYPIVQFPEQVSLLISTDKFLPDKFLQQLSDVHKSAIVGTRQNWLCLLS